MLSDWPMMSVGDLAAEDDGAIAIGPFGSSMKADVYTATGVPVVRGNNLTGKPGFYGDFVFVPTSITDRFARCVVRPGDLVFPHRGAIGEVGLVIDQGYSEWMLSTSMMKLRVHPQKLDPHFAFYFFRSPLGRHQLLQNASQVGTPGISQPLTSLRACALAVPTLKEQRGIVEVLRSLDDKIEQNRRTGATLEGLARAVFKAWFVDFEPVKVKAAGATGFPGMPAETFAALPDRLVGSELGPVPEGWRVVDVYDLAKVVYGAPFASKLFNGTGDGTPLIRIRDLQTHAPSVCTTEKHPKGTLIRPGEIVVGMDGEFRLHYWTGPEAWLNQRLCSFQPLPSVPPMFLGESLRAPLDYVERSEAATTVIHLGKYDIDRFQLIRPDAETLEAFDTLTTPVLRLMVQAAAESAKLAALRDYLLPRLLSGRVRVADTSGKDLNPTTIV